MQFPRKVAPQGTRSPRNFAFFAALRNSTKLLTTTEIEQNRVCRTDSFQMQQAREVSMPKKRVVYGNANYADDDFSLTLPNINMRKIFVAYL